MADMQLSEADVQRVIAQLDENKDGKISWSEFSSTMHTWLSSRASARPDAAAAADIHCSPDTKRSVHM